MYIKDHNIEAYNRICDGLSHSNRVATVCATGTGKSYQALQLIWDNSTSRILFITSLDSIRESFARLVTSELGQDNVKSIIYDNLSKDEYFQHWDIIILDEFHRAGAEIWGRNLSTLLEINPNAKVLGLSATPVRYLDDMRNMADELFEGNVVYELSLPKAIATGILPIPEYVSCLYSAEPLEEKIQKYEEKLKVVKRIKNKGKIEQLIANVKQMVAQLPEVPEILQRNIHNKSGHYIIFCSNKEQLNSLSKDVETWFRGINLVNIYSVYYEKNDNEKELQRFLKDDSNAVKLLLAINMINEGIHADSIDGVIFMRPTVSPNVYLQQMGRALSSGKADRPLVLDMVNNLDCIKMSKDLAEEVNAIIEHNYFDDENRMLFSIQDYVQNIEELLSSIESSLFWGWDDWYSLAQEYYEKNGNLNITRFYKTTDEYPLGEWIHTQRVDYKKGILLKERISKLESLEMTWEPWQIQWDEGLRHARLYFEKYGHINVPKGFKTSDGFNLDAWINNKRGNYKRHALNPEQVKALEELGIAWSVFEMQWAEGVKAAQKYYYENGNIDVPRTYITSSGLRLGQWISERRRDYSEGRLSEEQIRQLNELKMTWDRNAQAWSFGLKESKDFYTEYGHLVVPRKYISPSGFKLGYWISGKRQDYKKDKLNIEQISSLEECGMVWDREKIRTHIPVESCDVVYPEEIDGSKFVEGASCIITVNSYERDKKARKKCIDHFKELDGTIKCQICGFSFGDFYGDDYNNIIEVHHIIPLSDIRSEYVVDPIKDLIPVCPNCHCALHSKNAESVDGLKLRLSKKHNDY